MDNINKPDHYVRGGMECRKVMLDWVNTSSLSPEQAINWGNIFKYIWRFDKKDGLKDLKKARRYLDWLIESYENLKPAKYGLLNSASLLNKRVTVVYSAYNGITEVGGTVTRANEEAITLNVQELDVNHVIKMKDVKNIAVILDDREEKTC